MASSIAMADCRGQCWQHAGVTRGQICLLRSGRGLTDGAAVLAARHSMGADTHLEQLAADVRAGHLQPKVLAGSREVAVSESKVNAVVAVDHVHLLGICLQTSDTDLMPRLIRKSQRCESGEAFTYSVAGTATLPWLNGIVVSSSRGLERLDCCTQSAAHVMLSTRCRLRRAEYPRPSTAPCSACMQPGRYQCQTLSCVALQQQAHRSQGAVPQVCDVNAAQSAQPRPDLHLH